MNSRKAILTVLAILMIAVVGFAVCVGPTWWRQHEWFDLQSRQMATIRRLGDFPPPGWDERAWRNAIVTPNNVWGNVTYAPHNSKISNADMRILLSQLEQILTKATPENNCECVDRVFELLLDHAKDRNFVSGFREEFKESCQNLRNRSAAHPRGAGPAPQEAM